MYRDENVFDALLEDINEHNLALKTTINDVDLLIFSSLELPREHWSKFKLLSFAPFTFLGIVVFAMGASRASQLLCIFFV